MDLENIITEIKKAQTDVAVAEKFFQFVSDPELVDVAIYNLEAKILIFITQPPIIFLGMPI